MGRPNYTAHAPSLPMYTQERVSGPGITAARTRRTTTFDTNTRGWVESGASSGSARPRLPHGVTAVEKWHNIPQHTRKTGKGRPHGSRTRELTVSSSRHLHLPVGLRSGCVVGELVVFDERHADSRPSRPHTDPPVLRGLQSNPRRRQTFSNPLKWGPVPVEASRVELDRSRRYGNHRSGIEHLPVAREILQTTNSAEMPCISKSGSAENSQPEGDPSRYSSHPHGQGGHRLIVRGGKQREEGRSERRPSFRSCCSMPVRGSPFQGPQGTSAPETKFPTKVYA